MEQNTIKIENIKVGDKVIKADGLSGKVIGFDEEFYNQKCAVASYENNTKGLIFDETPCNVLIDPIIARHISNFYLIGSTILGNKVPVREIEQRIEANKAQIEQIKVYNAQLAKQAWRLRSVMTGEYPIPADKRDDEAQRIKKQIAFIKSQMAEITQTRIKLDSPTLAEQAYKAYAEELNRLQDGE